VIAIRTSTLENFMPDHFLLAADLHIKPCTWSSRPEIHGDSFAAFRQLIDLMLLHNCHCVIPGDFWDNTRPTSQAVVFVQQELLRLHGQKIFLTNGNHDGVRPSWALLLPNVVWVDKQLFEPVPGLKCYALDYRPPAELEVELAQVNPDAKVLFCHQMLDLSTPFGASWNMRADWVPGFIRHVFMGDYHQGGTWHRPSDGLSFTYPGSTYMTDWGDPPTHQVLKVTVSPTGSLEASAVQLVSRVALTFRIDSEGVLAAFPGELDGALADEDAKRVNLKVDPFIQMPMLRVKFDPALQSAATRIRDAVGGRAHLFLSPTPAAVMVRPETDAATSLSEALAKVVDRERQPDLFAFLTDLLGRIDDTELILRQWAEKAGVAVDKKASKAA